MRKTILIGCLSLSFLGIISLFWYNEWVFSLPTSVPEHYKSVDRGSAIDPGGQFRSDGKPLFLHFFNPDCPCSRFNITHFKSLVRQYGKEVDFGIVVLTARNYTATQIQDKFDIAIPVSFDSTLAARCGVYSTPQAVILTSDHRLYFRGNYNKSRYCTEVSSNYAQIALEGILHKDTTLIFNTYALTAYGCRLPECKK
jgi:hypothetical protein